MEGEKKREDKSPSFAESLAADEEQLMELAEPGIILEDQTTWRLLLAEYRRLESDFLGLTYYIPLVSDLKAPNYNFGSPATSAFGLDASTTVETAFRRFLRSPRFDDDRGFVEARKTETKGKATMNLYREVIAPRYGLAEGGLRLIGVPLLVRPFDSFARGENPEWFRTYSRLKHDRIDLAAEWTLRFALESLAGLALVLRAFVQAGLAPLVVESEVFENLRFPRVLNPYAGWEPNVPAKP